MEQMYNLKDRSNKKYSELGRYIEKSLQLFQGPFGKQKQWSSIRKWHKHK